MGNNNKILSPILDFFLKRPEKVKEENHHPYIILSVAVFFAALCHGSWIPLFWYLGVKPLAYFNFFSVTAHLISIYLNRRGFHLISMTVSALEIYMHQALCVILIGWEAGFQYYILLMPVGIYLMPQGRNYIKFILALICFLLYSGLDLYFRNAEPIFRLDPSMLNFFTYSNLMVFILTICLVCYLFNNKIYDTEKALREEQNKTKKAYGLLSKYVAPQLTETISDGQVDLIWRHSRKKLTLFFSDISNFTGITDSMEPEDMAGLLNEYLTKMNVIINKYNGTLAQVIGDGLYVFFGAPQKTNDKDHAIRCVKMAIDMQSKMEELNTRWFNKGIDENLKIRCGINTGMTTVGGYGSSERKEYTAMGMQVNIAARLEQACEPGNILISHTNWALVRGQIPCTEKGQINIKGYHKALRIYNVDIS